MQQCHFEQKCHVDEVCMDMLATHSPNPCIQTKILAMTKVIHPARWFVNSWTSGIFNLLQGFYLQKMTLTVYHFWSHKMWTVPHWRNESVTNKFFLWMLWLDCWVKIMRWSWYTFLVQSFQKTQQMSSFHEVWLLSN